jgi:hypothetical protein
LDRWEVLGRWVWWLRGDVVDVVMEEGGVGRGKEVVVRRKLEALWKELARNFAGEFGNRCNSAQPHKWITFYMLIKNVNENFNCKMISKVEMWESVTCSINARDTAGNHQGEIGEHVLFLFCMASMAARAQN